MSSEEVKEVQRRKAAIKSFLIEKMSKLKKPSE